MTSPEIQVCEECNSAAGGVDVQDNALDCWIRYGGLKIIADGFGGSAATDLGEQVHFLADNALNRDDGHAVGYIRSAGAVFYTLAGGGFDCALVDLLAAVQVAAIDALNFFQHFRADSPGGIGRS